MNIFLNMSIDKEEVFEMFGLDKNHVTKRLKEVIAPAFKQVTHKAIEYMRENNEYAESIKDYLVCSEKSAEWASDFCVKVNEGLTGERFYIPFSFEKSFWSECVYFQGVGISIGVHDPIEAIKTATFKSSFTTRLEAGNIADTLERATTFIRHTFGVHKMEDKDLTLKE